jgi:hypothetical protein
MSKSLLNKSATPWYPLLKIPTSLELITEKKMGNNNGGEIRQMMEMSYEEFRQKLLTNTLPMVKNKVHSFTPLLLRSTNVPYRTYPEWAYDHRYYLNKLSMDQFFESSPFSKVDPENERVDVRLEELYEEEEKEWIQNHPEVFKEDHNRNAKLMMNWIIDNELDCFKFVKPINK